MEYQVLENGQVMQIEQIGFATQSTHYKMVRGTALSESGGIVSISIQSWEGMPIDYEPVPVIITGDQVERIETVCDDGTLELTGPIGAVLVIETRLPNADNARLEVTLP